MLLNALLIASREKIRSGFRTRIMAYLNDTNGSDGCHKPVGLGWRDNLSQLLLAMMIGFAAMFNTLAEFHAVLEASCSNAFLMGTMS
jgi:hypothetical protein